MQIDSGVDVFTIVISIIFGVVLSFIYDIFKSLRISFKCNKITIMIEDILYSVISALLVFLLLLVRVKGEIRLFVLLFLLLGFLISKTVISNINTKVISKALITIKRKLLCPIISLLKLLSIKINEKIDRLFTKKAKKVLKDKV